MKKSQHQKIVAFAKRRHKSGFTYLDLNVHLQIGRAQPRVTELMARGYTFREQWEKSPSGARFKRFWLIGEPKL